MKATAGPPFRVVVYEGNGSQPLDGARKGELLLSLLQKGYAVTVSRTGGHVSDAGVGTLLVLGQFDGNGFSIDGQRGITPEHARALHPERSEGSLPSDAEETLRCAQGDGLKPSLGFQSRTTRGEDGRGEDGASPRSISLLPPGDVPAGIQLHFRDIQGMDTPAVMAIVESVRTESQAPKPGGWKPWFPVIDFGRCTNCMQCLSFCLFDVYGVSTGGKIQVQNQDNCKTDCPACSRVCPEVAILFPKYRFGPVNGDEINPDDLRREAMKVDISALLGGDIYAALRDRSEKAKSRFSKERDEERALKERQRCLEKLHQSMDIPSEVLASLPSVDQIQVKAREAKARAEAALQANAARARVPSP